MMLILSGNSYTSRDLISLSRYINLHCRAQGALSYAKSIVVSVYIIM